MFVFFGMFYCSITRAYTILNLRSTPGETGFGPFRGGGSCDVEEFLHIPRF